MGLIASALLTLPALHPPPSSLVMLSVGQGESMLLTLSNGENILIDGGGLYSSSFDTGERLVAPALARLGVKRLKGIIMSHNHPDHSTGLAYILNTLPTDSFWQASDEKLPESVQHAITNHSIPRHLAPPGWSLLPETGTDRITLFHPCITGATPNDHSLVVLAEFSPEQTMLLAGDIESAGVRELQTHTPSFAPALLKLPHHGSRHSAPQSYLDHFPAQQAIVSVGQDNRFGLPHPATLKALDERSIPLWRTDRDGTLRVRPQGRGWIVECWNNGDFR
jgi:competence protein ComEC